MKEGEDDPVSFYRNDPDLLCTSKRFVAGAWHVMPVYGSMRELAAAKQ